MKKFFFRLWKDPVWSKVIAVAMIAAFAFLWSQLFGPLWVQVDWAYLLFFLHYTISLNVSIILAISAIIVLIILLAIKKKPKRLQKSIAIISTKNLEPSKLLEALPTNCRVRRQRYGELEVISNTKDIIDAGN